MHLAARSALLASCLAISVQALPVTYSVVDVDGGSSAAADSPSDQPATVYHTVTKSPEAKEPEPTTVSVTILETETTKEVNVSTSYVAVSASNAPSSPKAPANVSSTALPPAATTSSSLDALSVLESAQSTFLTSEKTKAPSPAQPTTTQAPASKEPTFKAPPPAADAPKDEGESDEDCDVARVTVTADVPEDEEPTAVPTAPYSKGPGETVTLLSTTTVTPGAAGPTSYYDDGMWHTRYPIKPSAAPEAGDAAPAAQGEKAPAVDEKTQETNQTAPVVSSNTTTPAANGTYHARRQFNADAATPTLDQAAGTGSPQMLVHPFVPAGSGAPIGRRQLGNAPAAPVSGPQGTGTPEMLVHPFVPAGSGAPLARRQFGNAAAAGPSQEEGTGTPQMLVHPFVPQATGIAPRALPTGEAAGTGIFARALPTGVAASGIFARALPTGEAAGTGIFARALPTGEAAATGIFARTLPTGEAATGIFARALPTGEAAADPEVLLAESAPTAAGLVARAVPTGYSVVSWNETSEA